MRKIFISSIILMTLLSCASYQLVNIDSITKTYNFSSQNKDDLIKQSEIWLSSITKESIKDVDEKYRNGDMLVAEHTLFTNINMDNEQENTNIEPIEINIIIKMAINDNRIFMLIQTTNGWKHNNNEQSENQYSTKEAEQKINSYVQELEKILKPAQNH